MDATKYISLLEQKYSSHFDVQLDTAIDGRQLALYANCNVKHEKYVVVRKASIASWETNEHCLVQISSRALMVKDISNFTDFLVQAAKKLVKPHSHHMHTLITGIFLSEQGFEDEAVRFGKRFNYTRSYLLGFHGWSSIRLVLVDLKREQVHGNARSKEVLKFYSIGDCRR